MCEVDLREGGEYRFVRRHEPDGETMGVRGVYRAVAPPGRLVHTERFDAPWYPGESPVTHDLAGEDGRTVLRTTLRHASKEARDGVVASPMERGVAESCANLDALVASDA